MINTQILLEREMFDRGVARYHKTQEAAVAGGRESETTYAKRLIPEYIRALAEGIEESKTRQPGAGRAAKYVALLQGADSEVCAHITLRYIFDSLILNLPVTSLCIALGQRVEDQIRFKLFEDEFSDYYKAVMDDFKRKNTTNYRHMHRVLIHKAIEYGQQWNPWTEDERLQLGARLVDLCITRTGLVQKATYMKSAKNTMITLAATPETLKWITEHKTHAELLYPECMPCVVPPCDWVALDDGGYYTPEIRNRVPFIKIKSKAHRAAIKDTSFSEPMQAVNKLQKTAWSINYRVHDVLKAVWKGNLQIGLPATEPLVVPESPFPKGLKKEDMTDAQYHDFLLWKRAASKTYTAERERFSKCLQLSRVMQMASKYRAHEALYYVYTLDFRGRIYCTSPGLTPQGADFSKGLLQFAEGKPLGERGAYWLAVHGANVFGYDKASYDDRNAWVKEHEAQILSCAKDPMSSESRSFWADADKPWQFLAFCFEWLGYIQEGTRFCSRLPIALDGSCNGLQNFSAMLRDTVGASATNLTNTDTPEDIYQRVADVCTVKLTDLIQQECSKAEPDVALLTMARQWLEFGITRKCAKRPVMTLPYGSTRQSCREYIEDYIIDNISRSPWEGRDVFKASVMLTAVLWDSIGEVVVAARAAMNWLQDAGRMMSKANLPIRWTTPTGFLVYQGTMQQTGHIIRTQLCGVTKLTITTDTPEIDSRRQVLGVAPNFVHSMDASHLVKTVVRAHDVDSFAMIHDSYGTYACDTDNLHTHIRAAFVAMYSQQDVLQDIKTCCETSLHVALPDIPPQGTFDIQEVHSARYFFG